MATHHVMLRRSRLAAHLPAFQAAVTSDSPLAITRLHTFPVREPVSRRVYTIVKIETRGGLTGYGECGSIPAEQIAQTVSLIQGMPATSYEVVRKKLGAIPGMQAAVNIALLDIVGKQAKAPIYRVLAGPTRNKARAMTRLSGNDDAALVASMTRAREHGYLAFHVPLPPIGSANQGQAFVSATRKRLDALRAKGGAGVDFILDGAGSLSPSDAGIISAAFETFHLMWFDEPCAMVNSGALRKVSAERVTPLGFGRTIHNSTPFQELLREQSIDVLRPDLARNGITQIRRMAAMAETYYTAVAPYHDGGPIGTAAALHLAASLPNFVIQQIPLPDAEEDQRMRAEIAGAAIETVKDGFAPLLTGDGLGIKVNEQALAKYAERAA